MKPGGSAAAPTNRADYVVSLAFDTYILFLLPELSAEGWKGGRDSGGNL